ncbi:MULTISPECIES: hypothetical protein [unclassified Streptomyces]|uniref:hypothetical protein n=1 Tax=unclassified Streptomyces TaxID=2593676 RepID=UPI00381CF1A2
MHDAISSERLTAGLTVISPIGEFSSPRVDLARIFADARELTGWHTNRALTVLDTQDGSLMAWPEPISIGDIAGSYVAYRYSGYQQEELVTPKQRHPVTPYANFASTFAIPYFLDLREALTQYGYMCIKEAQCDTFSQTWRSGARISFKPKPEMHMRRSLQRHLRASLRDHRSVEVMPEQNVNETRPVDIKVHWASSNRIALIEIKWLGVSYEDGKPRPTQYFPESRAVEGAEQLATYLDLYHKESPEHEARGYLTVVDGRRRRVREDTQSINRENGFHYQYAEITYPPDVLARPDFAPPVRLFCEPVITADDDQ